jgi:hypothetical protein
MLPAPPKEIFRVRIVSAKMPTYWYAQYIGRYMYALEIKGQLYSCSEYGIYERAYFDREDVVIDKVIQVEDKRVVK